MKPSRIFITHSSHDSDTATKIRDYLEVNGIHCWMAPRDIPVGAEWAEAILDGIENASGMLLVFSSNSNNSSQVRREIERAIHNSIPIFPVRIEDVVPSKAMEYYISSNHWMDAFGGNFKANLSKLVAAIKLKQSSDNESRHSTDHVIEEPVQDEPTHVPTSSADKGQKPHNRKFPFSKLSLKIPRKVILPVVFPLLVVAGFFFIVKCETPDQIGDFVEETALLPTDSVVSFIKYIGEREAYSYASDIVLTWRETFIIAGQSYTDSTLCEVQFWLGHYDQNGNELWRVETETSTLSFMYCRV